MKKIKLGIILLSLSMLLVSCGGTPEEKVAKYVENSLATSEMQEAQQRVNANEIQLTVLAEGTTVLYQYKLQTDVEDYGGAELVKEKLETTFTNEEEIQAMYNLMEECPEVTSVKIECYDMQGTLITSTEIKQV